MASTSAATTSVMQVKIYAPFVVYFDGTANSLSAVNETGPFDILPGHKNFMSLLNTSLLTVRQKGRPDFVIRITEGMMHVNADRVTVFLAG